MVTRIEEEPPVLTTETAPRVPVPALCTVISTVADEPGSTVPVTGVAESHVLSARIRKLSGASPAFFTVIVFASEKSAKSRVASSTRRTGAPTVGGVGAGG